MKKILIHGDILYADSLTELKTFPDSWMLIEDGKIVDILRDKPSVDGADVRDYGKQLIMPAFADIHFHSVQYGIRGIGLNKELLPWLEAYTFKEEARFKAREHAEKVFRRLINELWSIGTLHICTFASLHRKAANLLMEMYDKAGFSGFVGKVNMDTNNDKNLVETTEESIRETEQWLEDSKQRKNIRPIITPRFAPSCTEKLLRALGDMVEKYDLYVQSHLNENMGEIELVKSMFPDYPNYYRVYRDNGLTPKGRTVMAHCVHNTEPELELMLEDDIVIAHSPASNMNLLSGIMPLRRMLKRGYHIGLASDVAGGDRLFMGHAVVDAIRSSKVLTMQTDGADEQLSFVEGYYLATAGGGALLGPDYGHFRKGAVADYLVIDDACWPDTDLWNLGERLEQYLYLGGADQITERCAAGRILPKPFDI